MKRIKKLIVILFSLLLPLAVLNAESSVVYAGTGATGSTASLLVKLTSNYDLLSLGFSSSNPGADHSTLTPISVITLERSPEKFSGGSMTVKAKAEFYAYWQIQQAGGYKISLYRTTNLLTSSDDSLGYTAVLADKASDNSIPVSADGSSSIIVSSYSGGNVLEKGSAKILVQTEEAGGKPYGTTFTGTIYIKVSSAT